MRFASPSARRRAAGLAFGTLIGLVGAGVFAGPAAAATRPVAVAELFTSQGCSSVPPANRNLIGLGSPVDLLPLSFSVTYWDDLGWKDTFGSPAFTARQRAYEAGLRHDGPFTPQIVVNGSRDVIGNKAEALGTLVAAARPPTAAPIEISRQSVAVGAGSAPARGADIWLVRYRPGVQNVAIARGENAGTVLPVGNVVTDIRRLGTWTGAATTLPAPEAGDGLRTAVLVQEPGGPILAAAAD